MNDLPSGALRVVDLHTAGEPVRIVEAGYPELVGRTLLEKRRDALARWDGLRRRMMLEPRGHSGMYGVIPTPACRPDADLAVLFTHQEGYSTMCGHATIAIGRWMVDTGRASLVDGKATFGLEAPCGLVRVEVEAQADGPPRVSFESVESWASHLDVDVEVPALGLVRLDIAFGGAFYAILPSSRIGLPFAETPIGELVAAGVAITQAVRTTVAVRHPHEPDLGFLYGVIITDDVELGGDGGAPTYNLCVFAEGQIDRSPTGSGVTARLALAAARGEIGPGAVREFRGVSGQGFQGALCSVEATDQAVVSRVRVTGVSHYSGRSDLLAETHDPFRDGFALPHRFAEVGARPETA